MRKLVIAFDGSQYSEGAMAFARQMNYAEKVSLTGLFLPQTIFSNMWSYADSASATAFIPMLESDDAEQINSNIERFERECNKYGIKYTVKKEFFDLAIPELQKETRFADLVIIGAESFYNRNGNDDETNEYLKDTLHSSECPVVVVPESYHYPTSNILAYDGSESSVFAIKQFVYLFPEFADNPTLLVSVREAASKHAEHTNSIRDLASDHFSSLSYINLDIDPDKYFATWISEKKNSILVCGAFSRSMLSQILRKSFVEEVLKEHRIPVFISHK